MSQMPRDKVDHVHQIIERPKAPGATRRDTDQTVDRLERPVRHASAIEDRQNALEMLLHRPAKLHARFQTAALRPGKPSRQCGLRLGAGQISVREDQTEDVPQHLLDHEPARRLGRFRIDEATNAA